MARHPGTVEVWYDGAWHALPVRDDPGLSITRDVQAEIVTSRLTATIGDPDGHYNPRNPASPLFGKIGKNTPIRATIDGQQRFEGVVASWRPRRTPEWVPGTGRGDAWVEIQAAGESRRLGQGTPPAPSPVWRAFMHSGPAAYWPCEDGGDSSQVASALSGHPPIRISGVVEMAQVEYRTPGGNFQFGTRPLPDLAQGGSLSAIVPAGAVGNQWTVHAVTTIKAGSLPVSFDVLDVHTDGGDPYQRYVLRYFVNAGGALQWEFVGIAVDEFGSSETVLHTVLMGLGDVSGSLFISARQNGGNIDFTVTTEGVPHSFSIAGTLAPLLQIDVNSRTTTATAPLPVGHIAAWATYTPVLPSYPATTDTYGELIFTWGFSPWSGEAAHLRLARLCEEDGVPFTCPAVPEEFATRMGPQPAATLLDLLRECAKADDGLLIEPRTARGFAYRPRWSLYAQTPTLVLDKAIPNQVGYPLVPVLDDTDTRNDVTVGRAGGSSARAVDEASVAAIGRTQTRIEVSLADDRPLDDMAHWHLAKGTIDANRYESILYDFDAAPELAADAAALDVGDVLAVRNTEEGGATVLVTGYEEKSTGHRRTITFHGPPYAVWDVARWDDFEWDSGARWAL